MPTFKYTLSLPNGAEKAVEIVTVDRDAADAKIARDYGVTSSGVITCEESDPDGAVHAKHWRPQDGGDL